MQKIIEQAVGMAMKVSLPDVHLTRTHARKKDTDKKMEKE